MKTKVQVDEGNLLFKSIHSQRAEPPWPAPELNPIIIYFDYIILSKSSSADEGVSP